MEKGLVMSKRRPKSANNTDQSFNDQDERYYKDAVRALGKEEADKWINQYNREFYFGNFKRATFNKTKSQQDQIEEQRRKFKTDFMVKENNTGDSILSILSEENAPLIPENELEGLIVQIKEWGFNQVFKEEIEDFKEKLNENPDEADELARDFGMKMLFLSAAAIVEDRRVKQQNYKELYKKKKESKG